jgi:hypothetical protein
MFPGKKQRSTKTLLDNNMSKSSSGPLNDKKLEDVMDKMRSSADNADVLEQAHNALIALGREGKNSEQSFISVITAVCDAMKSFQGTHVCKQALSR